MMTSLRKLEARDDDMARVLIADADTDEIERTALAAPVAPPVSPPREDGRQFAVPRDGWLSGPGRPARA